MFRFSSIAITGASSGIGTALATLYAAPNVRLCLMGRDEQRLSAVAGACSAKGANVTIYVCDVRDREKMRASLMEYDTHHPVELLIANAGVSAGLGEESESEEQVREVFAVNVDGVLNTVLPLLPAMQRRRNGHVAIISSLAGLRGIPGCPAYSASKNAVRAFGEGLRGAYAKYGIRVSVVCPGYIRTPMTEGNSFPMPFIMDADEAAKIIARGLARGTSRIAFPLAFYMAMWLFNLLPMALTDKVMARLPTKAALQKNR